MLPDLLCPAGSDPIVVAVCEVRADYLGTAGVAGDDEALTVALVL